MTKSGWGNCPQCKRYLGGNDTFPVRMHDEQLIPLDNIYYCWNCWSKIMKGTIDYEETEMTKTGFCEICGINFAEVICETCGKDVCYICNTDTDDSPYCDYCYTDYWGNEYEEDDDE